MILCIYAARNSFSPQNTGLMQKYLRIALALWTRSYFTRTIKPCDAVSSRDMWLGHCAFPSEICVWIETL